MGFICSLLMHIVLRTRKFGYVEFASAEDMQTAMELNGKKCMGQELKMDKARSKGNSQEEKKGRGCFLAERFALLAEVRKP